MRGLIMDMPLLISSLIEFAARYHADTELVTRTVEGPIHRYTYADANRRAKRLANALIGLGVKPGDRIGTLAWNTHRHFEAYYGVSGIGAILHTINPRLFEEQLAYIIDHAGDSYLFVDLNLFPLVERLIAKIPTVKGVVVMTDAATMPSSEKIPNAICYETLISGEPDRYDWPSFDEKTASSLCYTSGTTGHPKGVLYSHRSTILHAYAAALPDALNLSAKDSILPVVPMFHANAWSLPYVATLTGAKLVMPGPKLDGASVYELLESEAVTFTSAVPTVWLMLLGHLRESGLKLSTLKRVVIGGSACPRSMMEAFERDYGVEVRHAWGMTEMSPLGTLNTPKAKHRGESREAYFDRGEKQGRPIYGVEIQIVDDHGKELPWDGKAFGDLRVRGPWIASGYLNLDHSPAHAADGWFSTGDVCTIDPDGYLRITDRSKDVIKSGGEWISSIDLENIAMGHPGVAEAAVIGVHHPKWDERPLLLVVPKGNAKPTREQILTFFDGKIAKWWLPDDVVFVTDLPHTATGKLLKTKLRDDFKDYKLPTA